MDIKVIGSSSSGNCYFLTAGGRTLILECGVNIAKIKQALNFTLSSVAGCLITHEHGDHSRAAGDLIKAGVDIYTSYGAIEALKLKGHRIKPLLAKHQKAIEDFTVLPFETEHDAAEPLGYLIYHPEFGKLLFATDTYYIRYTFPELNYIMLECNYDQPILERNLQSGSVPKALKDRVLQSHFSLDNVKNFLRANDLKECRQIYLMHLSNGNSDAKFFKSEIEKLTGVPVTIC